MSRVALMVVFITMLPQLMPDVHAARDDGAKVDR